MDAFALFAACLAGFVFIHTGVAALGLRPPIAGAIGEGAYRGVYSLLSIALIVGLWMSYGEARLSDANTLVWAPPYFLRHVTHLFSLIGVVFVVGGMIAMNPTAIGMDAARRQAEPAHGFSRITRHPFLVGVSLWAVGHLLSNGELVAMLLFGAMLLVSVAGMGSIDRKVARKDPEGWAKLVAATSKTPFKAILQGRNRLAIGEIWWRALVGVAAFAAIWWAHGAVFGLPVA